MKRTPVVSSQIASIGYDKMERILEVEFTSGAVYQYEAVSPQIAEDLIAAESVGKFFNKYIRGTFNYTKIAAEGADPA